MKSIHCKDTGKMIGWLHREYKETISVINFVGIKSKGVVTRGWRKSNLTEYSNGKNSEK